LTFGLVVVATTLDQMLNLTAPRPSRLSWATISQPAPEPVAASAGIAVDVAVPTAILEARIDAPRAAIAPTRIASAPRSPDKQPLVGGSRNDARAVQAVLNRYRDAASTLDVSALRAIWPAADVTALRKQFAAVREQNLEYAACRISSSGTHATASCRGTVETGFSARKRRPHVESKRWEFRLRKVSDRWLITAVGTQQS
jgi:hypothetical protein